MARAVACVACGRTIDQANSFFGAAGLLCPSCHMQQQTRDAQENLVRREQRGEDERLSRRTRRLAHVHAVMWSAFVIIVAAKHEWFAAMLLVVGALYAGLAARRKWGYWAALAFDATAVAAAI